MTDRIPLDHLTSDLLDQLCERLAELERTADIDQEVWEKADRECDEHIAAGRAFRVWGEQWRARAEQAEAQRDQHAAALTIVQSITAAWYASSEGRDVLFEDLAAAGHPLPEDGSDQPAAKPTKGPDQ